MNSNRLNEAIAILQTMNMEDCAMEIQDLINELERVKGIAGRRLDRIAQLQHDVAVLEDKLEDTRSELTLTRGHAAAHRTAAAKMAEELEDTRSELKDTRAELGRKSLAAWAAQCAVAHARIDAEFDARENGTFGGAPSRALEELGREPRTHLELGL
jgi:chromosome segregation ATPase